MKRYLDMLVLTRREQRVVIAIVLAVMLFAAVLHHRRVAGKEAFPRLKTMDQTGDEKTRLTDEAGSEPVDDSPK
jgi:hypothetical protein